MARPKKYRSEAERKAARREAARERRARRREDPILDAEDKEREKIRHKKRVKEGKIKLIEDMSEREKRQKRKQWRKYTRDSRIRKAALQNLIDCTPPQTPSEQNAAEQLSETTRTGRRRRARKHKAKSYRDLAKERECIKRLKTKIEKYKKKFYRVKKKYDALTGTPKKNVNALVSKGDKRIVKRKLLFGEVLKAQLTKTYKDLKNKSQKQIFSKILSGDLLKKYRLMKEAGEFLSYKAYRFNATRRNIRLLRYERNLRKDAINAQKDVSTFLEMDEQSWQCPGKKDYILRNGVKKQKRFLVNTLKNLHKLYLSTSGKKITYATFCKFRPFYIVSPKAKDRETCLCIYHENMRLVLEALHKHKIIKFSNVNDLIAAVTCENQCNRACYQRICANCQDKTIPMEPFEDREIEYFQWLRVDDLIVSKGIEKKIKVTVKKALHCSVRNLLKDNLNEKKLNNFLQHNYTIRHQQRVFRSLRNSSCHTSLCIQINFSENYLCKYGAEPQSVHFGGSKKQLSLHTGIAYCGGEKLSFATVSECLRHDARAIMAHLWPILSFLLCEIFFNITNLNVISDGPTSQYKNRTMFTIMGTIIPAMFPNIKAVTWNYSESGHGKGPADGVGGVLKRLADKIVAHRNDIFDVNTFIEKLELAAPNVLLRHVSEESIIDMSSKITEGKIVNTVKGSQQARQVTWRSPQNKLHFNTLSCLSCEPGEKCHHYALNDGISLPPIQTQNDPPSINNTVSTLFKAEDQLADESGLFQDIDLSTFPEGIYQPDAEDEEVFLQDVHQQHNYYNTTVQLDKANLAQDQVMSVEGNDAEQTNVPFRDSQLPQSSKFIPQYNEGDWVVVANDYSWLPGIIEEVNSNIIVSLMGRSKSNLNHFYWPVVTDRKTLRHDEVLYKLPNPPTSVSTTFMVVKEYKYIDYLHKNTMY